MPEKLHQSAQENAGTNLESENAVHVTRSQTTAFDWKTDCFFCGHYLKTDEKHPERSSISQTDIPSKGVVHEMCKMRNDEWGNEVELRLCDSRDFCASKAKYHRQCRANFFNGQGKPGENLSYGRPANKEMSDNFDNCVPGWISKSNCSLLQNCIKRWQASLPQ